MNPNNYIMDKNFFARFVVLLIFAFVMPSQALSQTVGVFYDTNNEQMKFAAGDIKLALEEKSFTVEMLPLSSLNSSYSNKKVVISLVSDTNVVNVFTAQGGTLPTSLGEQAYAIRTTTSGEQSYWAFGGDETGTMYGGIEIAEQITSTGFSVTHNSQESPFMLNRGMKLNMPLDRRIPTYVGGWDSTSTGLAIPQVWEMTFWKKLIDQQARYRYNLLSVWVHHPFPALVKVAGYEKASLPRIEGFNGYVKELNHDQRVLFWREVMQYAHNRGMKFYFFNWNIYADYASTQYPAVTRDQSNPTTIDYMYKSMTALINTYPELDGFGISAGDGMDSNASNTAKTTWTWNAIGKAVKDYATVNPTRKFNLIHRSIGSGTNEWNSIYAPLDGVGKVVSNYSHKYAQAHMYSAPTPKWSEGGLKAIQDYGKKSFITVRNDDLFYTNWGDPKFVRDFMNGIPSKSSVDGMYIGSDGYTPSQSFLYKDNSNNQQLDAERRWYMEMLWARLAYNPQTSDETFKRMLAKRFSVATSNSLFQGWALASRGIPRASELVTGAWSLDFEWYPEGCNSDPGRCTGFRTIYDFANMSTHPNKENTTVTNGSVVCDISNSAAGTCSGKKDTYTIANEMQADAETALTLMNSIGSGGNTDFQLAINNIKHLAYLSLYYAHKIRGATFLKAGQMPKAKDEMAKAYCRWISYTRLMEVDYRPTSFRSMEILPDWRYADAAVLKDYTDMGGVGIPTCEPICTVTSKVVGCAGSTVEIVGNNSCGGSVTLTAKPAANCNFVNFTDGTTIYTTNPLTVDVTVEKQYTATFASTIAPIADFTADGISIIAGTTVNFTDNSTNGPTSWLWSFPGGTPTSSNSQNPSVVYGTEGEYDVTITASNSIGSNSLTKTKHIKVGKAGDKVTALTGWVSGLDNPKISGSSRLMVVMVMGESSSDFGASSVSYGGQVMTKQTDRMYFTTSSRSYASIFTLNEAGVNAATSGSIVVIWNGSPSSGNSVYSTMLSNVDQTTPVTAVSNNALTGTTVTVPSAMPTATGDMIVMCGATANNNAQSFDNGFSKEFESDSSWGDGVGGYKIGTGVAENPSFTQSSSGRMVICAFVAKKMASNALGVNENSVKIQDKGIRIYPNPVSTILNIDFEDSGTVRQIYLFNALGQLLYYTKTQSANNKIDIELLKIKGFVIVQVIEGNEVSNHKVIVK